MPNMDGLQSIPNIALSATNLASLLPPPPPLIFELNKRDELDIQERNKINLINAIEFEIKNYEIQQLSLNQLHNNYSIKLQKLKNESNLLNKKINILKNSPTQNQIKEIYKKKQDLHNDYLRTQSIRIQDEQQLHNTNKENKKLLIIIFYLKQQLQILTNKYNQISQKQVKKSLYIFCFYLLTIQIYFIFLFYIYLFLRNLMMIKMMK